ncbi:MAG: hypothetical protein AAGI34_06075 [Pseudomonadota bacterium]
MRAMVLDGLMDGLGGLLAGAISKWNEGLVPFFTSPYGIFVLFLGMFLFLNSMRMKL